VGDYYLLLPFQSADYYLMKQIGKPLDII